VNEDRFEKMRNDINFWISNIDSKVSFALAFVGIIIGFILTSENVNHTVQNYIDYFKLNTFNYWQIIHFIIYMVSLISLVVSMILFFLSLKARIKEQNNHTTDDTHIFWGTIAKHDSFKDFKDTYNSIIDRNEADDFLSQVYINSKIAQKKSRYYNNGLKFLLIGTLSFIIFELLIFLF